MVFTWQLLYGYDNYWTKQNKTKRKPSNGNPFLSAIRLKNDWRHKNIIGNIWRHKELNIYWLGHYNNNKNSNNNKHGVHRKNQEYLSNINSNICKHTIIYFIYFVSFPSPFYLRFFSDFLDFFSKFFRNFSTFFFLFSSNPGSFLSIFEKDTKTFLTEFRKRETRES